ncbi:hypothetical protein [Dolichospermum phage Dfl-JY45]
MDRPAASSTYGTAPWVPLPAPDFHAAAELPVGTWVEAGIPDIHGRPVLQLREIALDDIEARELDREGRVAPEKRRYVANYAARMSAGEEPPPLRVLETFAGGLRLVDGHRRLLAAKSMGLLALKAWVSPVIAVPAGAAAAELLTMTAELAQQHLKPGSQTETPEFQRWFGDSKVVDGAGRPLVVYHGTQRWSKGDIEFGDVYAFDRQFTRKALGRQRSIDHVGSWFADRADDQGAGVFAHDAMYPVYLSIQNPWRPREGFRTLKRLAARLSGVDPDNVRRPLEAGPMREWLKAQGYDGIAFPRGTVDGMDTTVYVALEPEQIKSAIGNNGAFDPTDPRITFSRSDAGTRGERENGASAHRAFESWFGDSKVVDDSGKPLVVYHGTDSGSYVFKTQAFRRDGSGAGSGIWFTDSRDAAWQYAEESASVDGDQPRVIEAFLALANPYVSDDINDFQVVSAQRRDELEAMGFDGIIGTYPDGIREFVAFSPEQIKSAIDNRGAFEPVDPRTNVRQSDAVAVDKTENEPRSHEAFERWFAGSQVVDDEGQPRVVYHGTMSDFSVFEAEWTEDGAFHFGTKKAAWDAVYDHPGFEETIDADGNVEPVFPPVLIPVYLAIRNPMRATDQAGDWSDTIADAKRQGHDGIVYINEHEDKGATSWIAFRPDQIKSAIGNVGAFGQRPVTAAEAERAGMTTDEAGAAQAAGDIRFSRAAGDFYSPLLRSLEDGRGAPKRADAVGWQAWLDGAQRRGDFRKSERDWLAVDRWLNEQPGEISRRALTDFVRANEVRVQEVRLEADASPLMEAVGELFAAHGYQINVFNEGSMDEEIVFMDPDGNEVAVHELPNALAAAYERSVRARKAEPRHGDHRAVAGGENYRELLLTLPTKPAARNRLQELESEYDALTEGYTEADAERLGELSDAIQAENKRLRAAEVASWYKSSHWDHANVLAHVRMDEHIDTDGKRVLLIHELQSDWHQQGRKSGYGASPSKAVPLPDGAWTVEFSTGVRMGEYPSREAAEAGARRFPNLGVPDAPFKNTGEWVLLAMKHVVRWAAANGIYTVAWATGEQVAEMFDLSKQVDAVYYVANEGGTYDVEAYRLTARVMNETGVSSERVAALVGKELAEKIARGEGALAAGDVREGTRVFRGDELKVGGAGMRAFYDTIVPATVAKWAKPYGATVRTINLLPISKSGSLLLVPGARGPEVHAIDVTPQMRAAALGGFPLFARSAAAGDDGQWLAGTRAVDADGRLRVVYRGEYGAAATGFRTRLPSLTFTASPDVARIYATTPNRRGDSVSAPRVIAAHLAIRRPILETVDDPFFDFAQVERTLGRDVAERFAVRYADRVMATSYWADTYPGVPSVEALLAERPEALRELFVDAYLLLDDREFVDLARAAGYDGAIHLGNGASALEVEFRVFDPEQARPVAETPWQSPASPSRSPEDRVRGAQQDIRTHAEAVRRRTEALTSGWPVDVRVVDSPWHLPPAVRAHRDFDPSRVDAVQAYGQVLIVASRVRSDAHLQTLLAHEVVGHVGVERILGPERFERVLAQIDSVRAAGHHAELFAEIERRYEGADRRTQACEAIAVFAERGVRVSWLAEVIAAVRGFLRDTLKLPLAFGATDLEGLVSRAARAVVTAPAASAAIAAGQPAFSRTEGQPLWRSALVEAVERAEGAPKRADGEVWQRWLDGAQRRGEFRKSERDWVGVDTWLAGRVAVTREALAKFVAAHAVGLEEVLLEQYETREQASRRMFGKAVEQLTEEQQRELAHQMDVVSRPNPERPTEFAKHCPPGGENYRELLIQLPADPLPVSLQWEQSTEDMLTAELPSGRLAIIIYDNDAPEHGATLSTADQDGEGGTAEVQFGSVDLAKAAAPALVVGRQEDRPGFRSDHWKHPNVLVHLRFDERSGGNGKRTLFLIEIQSDWHQRGRKTGYASEPLSEAQQARHDALAARRDHLTTREHAELVALSFKRSSAAPGVPQAPFRQTEAWAMLAFKRAVRFAVDQGFDQVAWISGSAAAGLMQIAQHVDQLWYRHRPDGRLDLGGAKDGQYRSVAQAVAPTELERYVGKDLAFRIIEGVGREACPFPNGGALMRVIEGEDLRIGGEGMTAFYDQILPAAVKRWARPFGAAIMRVQIENTEGSHWAVDITPAMRAAVAGGQPMFYRAPAVHALETWFGDSRVVNPDGSPKVVYHGTGGDVEAFRRMPWASESPELACDYAAMRGELHGGSPNVMPLYMRIERPFDADLDLPSAVTVRAVVGAIVRQAQAEGRVTSPEAVAAIEARQAVLLQTRIREESGPHYSKHDFWHETRDFFGSDGAQALREIFEIAGFDGITMRECGVRTWGAFSPEQVKSAIGNCGAFDSADARIAFARSETENAEEHAPPRRSAGMGMSA